MRHFRSSWVFFCRPVLAGLGAIALSVGLADTVEATVVRLRSAASAGSGVVRLRQVADVQDADPEIAERLGEITLAPAPPPGGTLRIDFATVRSRLQAQGVNLARVEFTGSSHVTVTAPTRVEPTRLKLPVERPQPVPVPPARTAEWQQQRAEMLLADAVREHLARQAPDLGHVKLALHVAPDDAPRVLAAAAGLEVEGGAAPWDAPQRMTVRFADKHDDPQEIEIACRVAPYPSVLAVRHTLPAGHVLQPADLVWRQVEDAAEALIQIDDAVGRETKRTIRRDEVLHVQDIRQVPLVRNNDIVTVYSRRAGVTVKRPLKSRGDGSLGETVALVTLDGRQTVLARVTGYHEAEAVGSGAALEPADRVRFMSNP